MSETCKYQAFLSYNRVDARLARRVRGRLRRFHIDPQLVGRPTRVGPVPQTLRPIFRDRHDFFTRPSLEPATTAALADSAAFIILASPHSAQSKYVNKQVRLFKSRHPDRPVIVLIVEDASDDPETERRPPALRFAVAPEWAASPAEVLPPDLDQKGDGFDLAIAKVVGRLIGVAPDDVYRHAVCERRRRGRIRAIAAVAMAALVVVGGTSFWLAHQRLAARAEVVALVRAYSLASPTQAAVPGGKESLTQAITSIAEGASAEPRYDQALQLLKAGRVAEAEPALRAVAQDKARRLTKSPHRYAREAAAAYRNAASIAAISDPGRAREYYAIAARLDPADIEGMFRNGWFQQEAGQLDVAEASYRRVIASAKAHNTEWALWAERGEADIARERGRLDVALAIYREAEATAETLANADPRNTGWLYDLAISNERIGDVLMAQGNHAEALKSYRAKHAIIAALAKDDVDDPVAQSDLPASDYKISERASDLPAAPDFLPAVLTSHQASLTNMEHLAKANLADAGWRRDLAVSYERIGNLLVWQGNLSEALKSYSAGQAVVDRLTRIDPRNAAWQRDLAVSYVRIGDVLAEQHNMPDALRSYQASIAIAGGLVKADPDNLRWQRELSQTYGKVGDALAEQDNLRGALEAFSASLAIAERLAKTDLGDARPQRELAAAYNKVGDVLKEQGKLPDALRSYQASLAIAERLAKADPGNARRQSELSEMYDTVGDVLKVQDNLAEAVKYYQTSLAIAEQQAAADPDNAGRQHDLAVTYSGIGGMHVTLGNLPEALTCYRAGIAIAERLASADPRNAERWRDLGMAYGEVGDVLRAQGELPEALKSFFASLYILGRVTRRDPGNVGWQRDLSATHAGLGDVLKAQGKPREALKSYQASFAIAERLAKADPLNGALQRDLSVTYVRLADSYRKSGRNNMARKAFAAARGIITRLVMQFPHQAQLKRDYAWFDPPRP